MGSCGTGADSTELAKRNRYVVTLLTNLGARIESTDSDQIKYGSGETFFVNLRHYTNMAFADEAPGDGKGGWSDEGKNDLSRFPVGDQVFNGVPFDIIDPALNKGTSCIQPFFLKEKAVNGMSVNRSAKSLYFVYASTYVAGYMKDWEIARFVVNYTDGTNAAIPIRVGAEVNDWWSFPPSSEFVSTAWEGGNDMHEPVYATMYEWHNPYPEKKITNIDFSLPDKPTCRFGLIAITGVGDAKGIALAPSGVVKNGRDVKVEGGSVSYSRASGDPNIGDPRAEFVFGSPIKPSELSRLELTADFDEAGQVTAYMVSQDGKQIIAASRAVPVTPGSGKYSFYFDSGSQTTPVGRIWLATSQGNGSPVKFAGVVAILEGIQR